MFRQIGLNIVIEIKMATWKIKELRDRLRKKLDLESFNQACRFLTSLDWKIRAEKYHTRVAEQAFSEHYQDSEITVEKALKLAFARADDGVKFAYCQSVREFNLVAAVSVSHTTPELFSQLLAVLFFPKQFNVHKVTIEKVVTQLPEGELKSKFQEIMLSQEYDYLKAFTNMSKHISLVIPEYHISFEESEYHGVSFKDFDYRNRKYKSKRDEELLDELRVMRIRFVELGMLINESFH